MKLTTLARTGTFAMAAILALTLPHLASAQETDIAAIRAAAIEAGDVEAGQQLFKKCKSCHQVGDKAKNRAGPVLTNVVGSTLGSFEGFKYSKGMLAMKEEGAIWDIESLDAFLTKPRDFVAKTKMSFRGFKEEEDRTNVIAYLASVADE